MSPAVEFMKSMESKTLIFYLADIFDKLNALNKELQGSKKTLIELWSLELFRLFKKRLLVLQGLF